LEPAVVLLGAILLVLCLVLGAGVVLSNTEAISAEAFGVSVTNVSLGGFFLVGVIIGAVAVLALGMLLGGAARKRRKSAALKRQVRDARGEQETLAERNARLEAELERERTSAYPQDRVDGDATRPRT
jgi:membrane protein implicated in regulation of membrane protease activity